MQIANGGSISNIQGPQNVGTATGSPIDRGLGKDAFLKLLVAQLRNQNPLNPLQGTDFIAQTAQFSSLEQLQQINQSLATLATSAAAADSNAFDAILASGFLGKTVSANGSIVDLGEAAAATVRYTLPADAASVVVEVLDLQGNRVRTLTLGRQPAGQQQFSFNGLGDDGRALPPGRYVYRVSASNAAGGAISGVTTAFGQVTGVTFDGKRPYLVIAGALVPLSGVYSVSLASRG
jgi:flagellar basal-body rod modification protein FlgD